MANFRQTGQRRTVGRFAALVLSVLLGTGCTHTPPMSNVQPKPDPLMGVPPAPAFPNQPAGVTQPISYQPGGVPAIPALHSPTNNATLASTSGQSPIGTALAINEANRGLAPGHLLNSQKPALTPDFLPPNPNPKVEPVPEANPLGQSITPTASWQSAARVLPPPPTMRPEPITDDALLAALKNRGVTNQKSEQTADGLKLTCYVAVGTTGLRIYEVTAATYRDAAQAIVQQLEAQR